MNNYLLLLLIFFIFSCSGNDPATNENIDNKTDTLSIKQGQTEPIANEDDQAEEQVSNTIDIKDFPKKWILLTKSEKVDEYVIYHYCEAEDQQLWIEQDENGGWSVTVLYGQDSQKFKLVSFEAEEEEVELMQVVSGQFILENPQYPDQDSEIYDFMWNKDEHFGRFEGFFNEPAMMVNEEDVNYYSIERENCDYLNDM